MNRTVIFRSRAVLGLALAAAAGGCDSFLETRQPSVIEAEAAESAGNIPTLALSAQGNLFNAFDNVVVYGAWFSGEAHAGDSFTQRTEVARREAAENNSLLNSELFGPLALAISSSERVLEVLGESPEPAMSLHAARAAMSSGYAIELTAETFCQGVISSGLHNLGSAKSSAELSQEAVARFQRAIAAGTAAGSAAGATDVVNAARVGLARAYLQLGRYEEAAQAAALVPSAFTFQAGRSATDSRLGNFVYDVTAGRRSLVVPSYYRALGDGRVASELEIRDPKTSVAWTTVFGNLPFHKQIKYREYKAPLRLASGLLARYIAAEARLRLNDETAARALIAERVAAGGAAATFDASAPLLRQLLDQKARDFYLEGVHLGDWRRNPDATPYVPASGSAFYIAGQPAFGKQTCLPVPEAERVNNPNF